MQKLKKKMPELVSGTTITIALFLVGMVVSLAGILLLRTGIIWLQALTVTMWMAWGCGMVKLTVSR